MGCLNQVNVNYVFDNVSFTTSNNVPNIFATVGSVKSVKIINSDFSNINNTAVWFMHSVGSITIENSQISNADGFLKLRYGENCTINLKNNTIVDSSSVVAVEGKATTTTEIVLENNTIKNCEQVLYIKADEDNVVDTNDCVIRFTSNTIEACETIIEIDCTAKAETKLYLNNNEIKECENVVLVESATAGELVEEFNGNTYNDLAYTNINEFPQPKQSNVGLIVGLSVGGVIIVAGIVVAVVLILKKKKG